MAEKMDELPQGRFRKRRRLDPGEPQRLADDAARPAKIAKIVYQEVPLDMARTEFRPEAQPLGRITRLAAKRANVDAQKSIIVHHDMVPDANMDDILPLRDPDPDHPDRPHPLYAANSGSRRRARRVPIMSVEIAEYYRENLQYWASCEEADSAGPYRYGMNTEEIQAAISMLEQAVQAELERTRDGIKDPNPAYYTRQVTSDDVKPHERALIGQWGLFVRDDIAEEERPILKNGRILGLFGGAVLKTKDELERHMKAFGGTKVVDRYALDIKKSREAPAVTVSPLGGANSMAFANTALVPPRADRGGKVSRGPKPAYDEERINAIFVPFNVRIRDKYDKIQEEQVAAVVGLNNLRGQVFLEYGRDFLDQFRREHTCSTTIKREGDQSASEQERQDDRAPHNPAPDPSPTGKRYDLRSRDRERNGGRV